MTYINGEILEELRRIASEDSKTLPTKVYMRLLSAGLVGLHEKVDSIVGVQAGQALSIEKQGESMEEIQKQIAELRKTCFENGLVNNPLIQVGKFIKKHPKTTITIVIIAVTVILALSNLWFVESFRHDVMVMLRVPEPMLRWFFLATPIPPPP